MSYQRAASQEELEQRIRDYIERLENWTPTRGVVVGRKETDDDRARDHWFNCGMDEGYDNALDNLYAILGEER
jgi:hypothetical protein